MYWNQNRLPIRDRNTKLERWTEDWSKFYSEEKQTNPNLQALALKHPVMLELEDEPTRQDVFHAVKRLLLSGERKYGYISPTSPQAPYPMLKRKRDAPALASCRGCGDVQ